MLADTLQPLECAWSMRTSRGGAAAGPLRLAALAACAAVGCAHNTSYTNTTCCSCAAAGTEPADERGSVAFAFAMSIGAGMCTTIGGAASFLGRIEDKRILAASLATSAGVMLYGARPTAPRCHLRLPPRPRPSSRARAPGPTTVSFIEIFVKSLTGFTDQFLLDGKDEAEAGRHGYYAATGFFFLGMLLTRLLDLALHRLEDAAAGETAAAAAEGKAPAGAQAAGYAEGGAATATPQACGSCDKAGRFQLDAADKLLATYDENQDGALDVKELRTLIAAVNADLKGAESESRAAAATEAAATAAAADGGITQAESARLRQMGLFTALSIFVHNFPEGLATFIATLADPAAGAALAVAIGLHNIPEGVCVGFPIYYATGSRWKAFCE